MTADMGETNHPDLDAAVLIFLERELEPPHTSHIYKSGQGVFVCLIAVHPPMETYIVYDLLAIHDNGRVDCYNFSEHMGTLRLGANTSKDIITPAASISDTVAALHSDLLYGMNTSSKRPLTGGAYRDDYFSMLRTDDDVFASRHLLDMILQKSASQRALLADTQRNNMVIRGDHPQDLKSHSVLIGRIDSHLRLYTERAYPRTLDARANFFTDDGPPVEIAPASDVPASTPYTTAAMPVPQKARKNPEKILMYIVYPAMGILISTQTVTAIVDGICMAVLPTISAVTAHRTCEFFIRTASDENNEQIASRSKWPHVLCAFAAAVMTAMVTQPSMHNASQWLGQKIVAVRGDHISPQQR